MDRKQSAVSRRMAERENSTANSAVTDAIGDLNEQISNVTNTVNTTTGLAVLANDKADNILNIIDPNSLQSQVNVVVTDLTNLTNTVNNLPTVTGSTGFDPSDPNEPIVYVENFVFQNAGDPDGDGIGPLPFGQGAIALATLNQRNFQIFPALSEQDHIGVAELKITNPVTICSLFLGNTPSSVFVNPVDISTVAFVIKTPDNIAHLTNIYLGLVNNFTSVTKGVYVTRAGNTWVLDTKDGIGTTQTTPIATYSANTWFTIIIRRLKTGGFQAEINGVSSNPVVDNIPNEALNVGLSIEYSSFPTPQSLLIDFFSLKIGEPEANENTNPIALANLTDVNIPSPSDGDVLTYDNNTGVWVAEAPTGGGGGGGHGGHPLTDGDKGDITVSSNGTVWNIDAGVITTTELGGDITTAGKALLDDDDAAAQRTTLGLGTAATANTSAFAAASHTHIIADVTNLQTALDGKASLSHIHAISDVTNLQTELDNKWDATTAPYIQARPSMKPPVNEYVTQLFHADTLTTASLGNGRIIWSPIVKPYDMDLSGIGVTVTTGNGAGTSIASVAIYASDADNRPTGTPIWDMYALSGGASLSMSSTGVQLYNISPGALILNKYTQYWIAVFTTWSGGTNPVLRGINRISLPVLFERTNNTTTDGIVGLYRNTNPIVGGTPFPDVGTLILGSQLLYWNTVVPRVVLRMGT